MNESPFFAHLGRLRWIKRWGLMRNAYEENVMEHGWEVAVIAHALAVIRSEIFHQPIDADRVAAAALYHDVSEAITGDLPTPIKYHSPAIRDAYKDLEQKASQELLALLPEELKPAFARMLLPEAIPEDVGAIIKAADRIAAYLKCCAERRAGNTEFVNAEEEIREKIRQLGLPEVDYFMNVFVPGYELTLDRLVL
ncbi:5'-deoxynucleotidase [Methylococcus geothermalis]|uniref:5'-deoxynucleotidase n=1 Tax=Methylococcus geothermalis TaxID=2681310 RepID=A0A858Q6C1_9GAMM|nr:5'-deoxynucleotidase [Methylococcus geothermalis]QJD29334.1 5'-deoxynucleotidase [Methylococcus geothermalis]